MVQGVGEVPGRTESGAALCAAPTTQDKTDAAQSAAPHSFSPLIALLFLFLACLPAVAQTEFSRPATSVVFDVNTITTSASAAKVTGEFNLDTRAQTPDLAGGETDAFPVDTAFGLGPPLHVSGTVSSSVGGAVTSATIRLQRQGRVFWEGATGPGGVFTSPALLAQDYTIVVSKAGYVTLTKNPGGRAGGALSLALVLTPSLTAPVLTEKGRTPTAAEKGPPPPVFDPADTGRARLYTYQGGGLVETVSLNPNRMTVVITHGWNGDPLSGTEWERFMAADIQRAQVLANAPNIVVWSWKRESAGHQPPQGITNTVGYLLGTQLHALLGADYHGRIHFIGHSLGALVNRYACEYLHGIGNVRAAVPWSYALTRPHLTLMDEAEVASFLGSTFPPNAGWGDILARIADEGCNETLLNMVLNMVLTGANDFKSPIPRLPAADVWIDNYISMVGYPHPEALNVCLLGPFVKHLNLVAAHSYSHEWYGGSMEWVPQPSVGLMLAREIGGPLPPVAENLQEGQFWHQNLNLTLSPGGVLHPYQCMKGIIATGAGLAVGRNVCTLVDGVVQPVVGGAKVVHAVYGAVADAERKALDGYVAGIEFLGEKAYEGAKKVGQVATEIKEKAGYFWNAARDKLIDIREVLSPGSEINDAVNANVPAFILGRSPAQNQRAVRDNGATPTSPGIWLTVDVPANAALLAFDFTLHGNPQEACLVCAAGGQNVFSTQLKFMDEDAPQSVDPIDIIAYTGQTVELFFGLAGDIAPGAEVALDGIRFITIPMPNLVVTDEGTHLALHWPAAAVGWRLETSTSLAADSWQTIETPPEAVVANGVITVSQPRVEGRRFYRLRRLE